MATSATAFQAEFGTLPDFEIIESDTAVPNLLDNPDWGDPAALLQLGNLGDEVILRDPDFIIIDMFIYGTSSFPHIPPCPLATAASHSLERYPYWRDTNQCTDFRDWPFPNPGTLPPG